MIKKTVSEAKRRAIDTARIPKGGLAAPVAMAALAALSLGGCGDAKSPHPVVPNQELQREIKPVMVNIAKKALRFVTERPRTQHNFIDKGKDNVQVVAQRFKLKAVDEVIVGMGTDKNHEPDPSKVLFVDLHRSVDTVPYVGATRGNYLYEPGAEITLGAPGSGGGTPPIPTASEPTSSTANYPVSWSATETLKQYPGEDLAAIISTVDPKYYVIHEYDPGDALDTATFILGAIPEMYQQITTAIAAPSPHE